MQAIIIMQTPSFTLTSYGNGLSYELLNTVTGQSLFFQGDDAAQFRRELEEMEEKNLDSLSELILEALFGAYEGSAEKKAPAPLFTQAPTFAAHSHATLNRWNLVASLHVDENPNLSYLGEVSGIPNHPHALEHFRDGSRVTWFNPANPAYAEQDHERFKTYGDEWLMTGLTVTAECEGAILGAASLWGIESDSTETHFLEQTNQLARAALLDAQKRLKRLCNCK